MKQHINICGMWQRVNRNPSVLSNINLKLQSRTSELEILKDSTEIPTSSVKYKRFHIRRKSDGRKAKVEVYTKKVILFSLYNIVEKKMREVFRENKIIVDIESNVDTMFHSDSD
ncbi:hypothetical protein B9Z55_023766 [Caenorhabditis nigoni]|uniref:Uncharacterized protein n=1 Tax=Caenorhabditis nigoni TaxID=1611254 RepID=A0A2G5SRU0_9PELO|nr:hypothetical protein B9Z55_023766 [Caenorhabditis nigoni]